MANTISLSVANRIGNEVINKFETLVHRALLVGSIRRLSNRVQNIDILVVPIDIIAFKIYLSETYGKVTSKEKTGLLRYRFLDMDLNIHLTTEESWLTSLLLTTGPPIFNSKLKECARKLDLKLTKNGLIKRFRTVPLKTEKSIFRALRLNYVEPKDRASNTKLTKIFTYSIHNDKNRLVYRVTYIDFIWKCTCGVDNCKHVNYFKKFQKDGYGDISINIDDIIT